MIESFQNPALNEGGVLGALHPPLNLPAGLPADKTLPVEWPVRSQKGELIAVISIEDEGNGPILIARWLMPCPQEDFIAAFMFGLELFGRYGCKAYLNDGLEAASDWHELTPWLEYDILPRGLLMGVRAVAIVHNSDPAESLAFYKVIQYMSQYVNIRPFNDGVAGLKWLREQLAAAPPA